jgi:hypothetical protein
MDQPTAESKRSLCSSMDSVQTNRLTSDPFSVNLDHMPQRNKSMIKQLLGLAMGFALLGFICSTVGADVPLVLAAMHAALSNQGYVVPEIHLGRNRLTIC